MKPLLKWAGGKRWLVPHLAALYAAHRERIWVELFAGGLSAAFGLLPYRALVSDINPHLVNFYRHLQRGLKPLPYTENNEDYYYAGRELFNQVVRDGNLHWELLAQLFWYFNRAGYNGLIRFNKRGEFNTPFGRYKNPNLNPDFTAHTAAMQGWTVKHAHFRDAEIPAGSFLYCDPPYPNTFNSYTSEGFSWNEHVELAQHAAQHDGPTVVSNSADAEVLDLYRAQGFSVQVVQAPRSISCKADGRKPKEEMLATKNL